MAGENEELDMSLFNIDKLPLVKEQIDIKEETEETQEEFTTTENAVDKIKNIQADDENQESVGSQEEEETVEEEIQEDSSKSPANSDSEVFKTLGEYLKEQNVLSSLDTEIEINNLEDFAEAISKEVTKREFSSMNEQQKAYFDALADGVPNELYQAHSKSKQVFADITDEALEDNDQLRKQVIIQDSINQGKSTEWAEKQYRRLHDLGEDLEEAKLSRTSLQEKEEEAYNAEVNNIKQAKEDKIKADAKLADDLKAEVFKQEKVFDSFNVSKGLKTKVHDTMTKVVGYDENKFPLNALMKDRSENPLEFEKNLYYMYVMTNGFKDIKKFNVSADTTAANKVKNAISNSTFKTGANKNYQQDENSYSAPPIVDI